MKYEKQQKIAAQYGVNFPVSASPRKIDKFMAANAALFALGDNDEIDARIQNQFGWSKKDEKFFSGAEAGA